MYGVSENDSTETEKTVRDVFNVINEKPNIGFCTRVGKTGGDKPRPIKVCLSSTEAAVSLRKSGKRFRDSSSTKNIFVAPDRTWQERQERKNLVEILKAKKKCDPSTHYYISGSSVMARDTNIKSDIQVSKKNVITLSTYVDSNASNGGNAFDSDLQRAKDLQNKLSSVHGGKN